MVTKLKSIEEKYGFTYPELYKQLCKDGMLNFGETGPTWHTSEYPKLKENPPLLLYGNDIEFVPIDQIEDIYEDLKDPEYPGFNPELNFVPFLQNGAGDSICFFLNEGNGGDIPIAFVPHDSDEFEVHAKNLQDYIFREMLVAVVDVYKESLIADGFTENIKNMYNSHKKYLTDKQQHILEKIYARDLKEYTYKISEKYESDAEGLLTYDEYEKIIKKEIDFPLLDKELPLFAE